MPLPNAVVLQADSSPKILREESLVRSHAEFLDIPVREITMATLNKSLANSFTGELPVGSLPFMEASLKVLKKSIPTLDHYPQSLKPWFHRTVWQSSLGALERSFNLGERRKSVFIKPRVCPKLFKGRVVYSDVDIARLPYPKSTELLCSDQVTWTAEWRCYVIAGKIRDIRCYMMKGKPVDFDSSSRTRALEPNSVEMASAVEALIASGFPRTTITIDFGLLSTGQTALIELDDAYSVGAYGLSAADYFEFLWEGWLEVIN